MKSRLKKITLLVLALAALLFFANSSFAGVGPIQSGPCAGTRALLPLLPGAPNPCSSPAAYVVYWFYLSLYLAGIAALLILVFAGFMRLSSGLVPNAVSSANKMVTGAALGLILLFSGWLLLNTLNPALKTIGDSSFPPLGGSIMGFAPSTVNAGQSSQLAWTLLFEKTDHGILNCYDAKNNQTIQNKAIGSYGSESYQSSVEGKHFCRITAQDKDNNTVGLGYTDLIVAPACELTWKDDQGPGKGTLSWKTSNGATEARLQCSNANIACPGSSDFSFFCILKPPGTNSTKIKKGSRPFTSDEGTCDLTIIKLWVTGCHADIKFP